MHEDKEYPLIYETWIIPRKRYFFMIGAVSLPNSNKEERDEIVSIIKSLRIVNNTSVFNDNLHSIMDSHFNVATQKNYRIDDCLQIAKPYGMWDIPPLHEATADLEPVANYRQWGQLWRLDYPCFRPRLGGLGDICGGYGKRGGNFYRKTYLF